jgi:transcription elongation GreA/GreB family factor
MTEDARAGRPIQAGDRVTIRFESGRRRTVWITNGDGGTTPFDIAADSPLATALLGKRASDQVELELAPGAVIAFAVLRVG